MTRNRKTVKNEQNIKKKKKFKAINFIKRNFKNYFNFNNKKYK